MSVFFRIYKYLQRSAKVFQICTYLQRAAEILQICTDSQTLKTWEMAFFSLLMSIFSRLPGPRMSNTAWKRTGKKTRVLFSRFNRIERIKIELRTTHITLADTVAVFIDLKVFVNGSASTWVIPRKSLSMVNP